MRKENDSLYSRLRAAVTVAGATPHELSPEVRRHITANDPERWEDFFSALDNGGRLPERLSPIRLDTLTMIRRLQGRPEPLRIEDVPPSTLAISPYVTLSKPGTYEVRLRFAALCWDQSGSKTPPVVCMSRFHSFEWRP